MSRFTSGSREEAERLVIEANKLWSMGESERISHMHRAAAASLSPKFFPWAIEDREPSPDEDDKYERTLIEEYAPGKFQQWTCWCGHPRGDHSGWVDTEYPRETGCVKCEHAEHPCDEWEPGHCSWVDVDPPAERQEKRT